jgi:gliding motility-associated-like protein
MNDSVFCLPADFSATNISLNNKYNRWYVNENYIHDSTDFDSVFTAPGSYNIKLYVMDSTTCNKVDSFSRTIVASISAFSDFEIARDSCSLEVTFINKSVPSPGQPTTYLWDFGDGDTSNKANPSHRFERTGTYTITLITNPGTVCADTATKTYYIDGDSTDQIVVPNVFTPNNDNLNDCFQVTGVNNKCDEYHIWIRNRWGNLFYESTNPEACWNGKNEVGVDASIGVYYYIIKIKKYRGKEYDLNGTITLFR